jgi:hypothetical protein
MEESAEDEGEEKDEAEGEVWSTGRRMRQRAEDEAEGGGWRRGRRMKEGAEDEGGGRG